MPVFVEEELINWLMNLIETSIKDKSIHHFSLDFGSALLANIIHAPTTLAHLSANPSYAQHVTNIIIIVNGNNAEVYATRCPSLCSHAYSNLLVIPLQGGVLQSSKIKLQLRGEDQRFRGILLTD